MNSVFLATDEPLIANPKSFIQIQLPSKPLFKRAMAKFWRIIPKYINVRFLDKRAYYRNALKSIEKSLRSEPPSLPYSNQNILDHPAVKSADIIHLHWVTGVLDYPSFFKNNEKPVVWTIHDMNTIKGLFHYNGDEERNAAIAGKLDKQIFALKKKAIKDHKNKMALVSPSLWLKNAIKESNMFDAEQPLYEIPYPLDTNIFTIRNTEDLKAKLKIPEDHTILLFISQSIHNHRKGFDLLVDALGKLDSSQITLVIIGYSENTQLSGFNCINMGYIHDNEILSNYYSLADAFIIPSREDNLPNIMLESLCCGTPVISFNLGGMSEIVQDNLNGLKATALNSDSLKETIERFIDSKETFNSEKIRDHALSLFSQDIIAEKYQSIYKELLN